MIYQCYFDAAHRSRLFSHAPYVGFGLEPEVNAQLTRNCPELADPRVRMALAEYGAMLHIWRNPDRHTEPWIGFTSYRQLEKTPVVFSGVAEVERLLAGGDYLSWYVWDLAGVNYGGLTGLAGHSEANHPGIHDFIVDVLTEAGIEVSSRFYLERFVPYANYWVMSTEHFVRYMNWSWPLVSRSLLMSHPYLDLPSPKGPRDNKARAVGYFMERLFILWVLRERLRGVGLGPVFGHASVSRPVGSEVRQRSVVE